MHSKQQLTLWQAVMVNVNIMLGAGIFINTAVLAHRAGALGGFCYILVGILMLPLILSIAKLLQLHPAGGFYTYGAKELSPFFGFISTWSYFVGKLASATLVTHAAVLLVQQIIPFFAQFDPVVLDASILSLFIALNMLNLRTNKNIQTMFLILKIVPILCAILVGMYLFSGNYFTQSHFVWEGIPTALPLVLYATMGFEAACSISNKIKDAHKNAPLAVLLSYGIALSIAFLYQTMFYGAIGTILQTIPDYRVAFPALLEKLMPSWQSMQIILINILNLAIASSALGSAYGILFTNNWNLYALAQHKHVFAWKRFAHLNIHQVPWLCVLTEGIICFLYLLISRGSQVPLQQTSALGVTVAYTLSVLALAAAKKQNKIPDTWWLLPILGLFNCMILITSCLYSLWIKGIDSLFLYLCLVVLGIVMFALTHKKTISASPKTNA